MKRLHAIIWNAFRINVLLVMLLSGWLIGCASARLGPAVTGPVAAPPASSGVSTSTESLIAGQANAEAKGDTATAKALGHALDQQDRQEIVGGTRCLIPLGILVAAIGAGIAWYAGKYLGTGVILIGCGMVGGALFVAAIKPYLGWVAVAGVSVGVLAAAWHFKAYISAALHLAHGTEHLASGRVQTLIGRMRARGPGVVTKISSLLHHHAKAAIPPLAPTKPPATP